jgi:bis(5'-nucleosyl)-tetraphosphatase (symmetrical)
VHGGLLPDRSLKEQSLSDMTNLRSVKVDGAFSADQYTKTGAKPLVGSESGAKEGVRVPWVTLWNKQPHVYFGHDAKSGLQRTPHCTGLDTGCCYGTAVDISRLRFNNVICFQGGS